MIGLLIGVVFAFGLGYLVRPRFQVGTRVGVQVALISALLFVLALALGYLWADLTGMGLLVSAILWAALFPALMAGNALRVRVGRRT